MTLRTVRYDDDAWQLVPKTMARALFECAEALRDLLQDTQHAEHECDDEVFCPVKNGRAALARLDGEPTMPDGYQPLRADVERLRERDGRIWSGFARDIVAPYPTPPVGPGTPEPPAQQPMGAEQIASACYTYRHDFGLLPEAERHLLMAEARRWAEAFGVEVER